ncbi:MAG TPA: hydroxymethylbilane synthase [Candidatus Limnocylindrales bacterium]
MSRSASNGRSRPIRIGTRGSALALAQAEQVARALGAEGRPHRIVVVETEGDRRAPDTAWGEGAFVAAIEQALLDERVDIAVHSAKDVPTEMDERLRIAAYLPRADPRDALVAPIASAVTSLEDLPPGAVVGTDSPRRSAFVRAARPDLRVRPLHGNVDTRLRRLDDGEADALVLAIAGLVRLGREDRISAVLEPAVVPPAPGQGAIAVQIRATDAPLIALGAVLDDARTHLAVAAERTFLRATGGGCRSPIGALATIDGDRLRLVAGLATDASRPPVLDAIEAPTREARAAATRLAERLLSAVAGSDERPTVIVTRPRAATGSLAAELALRGIATLVVPAIEIAALDPSPDLDRSVRAATAASIDWTVVTSPTAARILAGHVRRLAIDARPRRWAAIGRATAAAIASLSRGDVWQPSRPDGATLVAEIPLSDGEHVSLVRGRLAGDRLERGLAGRGAVVESAVLYETLEGPGSSREPLAAALDRSPAAVVLSSPSAVRGLLGLAGKRRADVLGLTAVCVGPTTAAAAREAGFGTVREATAPDAASVAAAVAAEVSVAASVQPTHTASVAT